MTESRVTLGKHTSPTLVRAQHNLMADMRATSLPVLVGSRPTNLASGVDPNLTVTPVGFRASESPRNPRAGSLSDPKLFLRREGDIVDDCAAPAPPYTCDGCRENDCRQRKNQLTPANPDSLATARIAMTLIFHQSRSHAHFLLRMEATGIL
jgi:hypothetical protein